MAVLEALGFVPVLATSSPDRAGIDFNCAKCVPSVALHVTLLVTLAQNSLTFDARARGRREERER
jgi:hypothetical protein